MTILSVHVSNSGRQGRQAARALAARGRGGPTWVRAVRPLGNAHGFGAAPPPLSRIVVLCAWPDEHTLTRAGHDAALEVLRREPGSWWVQAAVASTRGSERGTRPLQATRGVDITAGPMATLTYGRTDWRRLSRFARAGTGLRRSILHADGLICAVSAGWPLSGNLTFSLWDDQTAMTDFAYGHEHASLHREVARARPGILAEQLNARLRISAIGGAPNPSTCSHPDRLQRLAQQIRPSA